MTKKNIIYTIGHSNYESDKLIKLLSSHAIEVIADVRQHPYSKYVPQFNKENIERTLSNANIKYVFMGDLLGARPQDINCYTDNRVDFAKLSKASFFQEGISRLLNGSKKYRIALMCAEKDPVTCHRTILVSRELLKNNIKILHILDDSTIEDNETTEKRLLKIHKLENYELFRSDEERLVDAYDRQGKKMAASIDDRIQLG
jgi:uncharacterized protein (DUF488 family)